MWFIGVPKEFCIKPIFPWHHETFDPTITSRALTHRTKTPFDKSLVIKTSADIEVLRREAEKPRSDVRRVRIQPQEEVLLRDKDTLRMVGELTKKMNAIILLEGGVLSHAYYQLMRTNAIIEVLQPFEDYEDKREFYKIVRDKIPYNIEKGGEDVRKTRLSGEFLLRALREKLVEESFEVLDASDQDSIVGELADVAEVVEGILSLIRVNRDELHRRQDKKREKAGGFKEGVVLLETRNPLPTIKDTSDENTLFDLNKLLKINHLSIDPREVVELSHTIDKWSDRKEHQAAIESILHLVIPMIRDNWTASSPETVIDPDSGSVALIKVTGKRTGAKLEIALSIFTHQKQLKLF